MSSGSTVTRLPNGRKALGPLWLWWAGPGTPDLALIWRACLHRSGIEHACRLARHTLGWDKAALRKPGKLSPGRVRRDFSRLAALAGTPASPPKPSKAGPGRPKGRRSTPAPRHNVIKNAA